MEISLSSPSNKPFQKKNKRVEDVENKIELCINIYRGLSAKETGEGQQSDPHRQRGCANRCSQLASLQHEVILR